MLIFRSIRFGVVLAVAAGALVLALTPFFDDVIVSAAYAVYATPAMLFLPLVPSKLVYWLDPNGGPSVGVFLLLFWATFFWTLLFGAVHFAWILLTLRRK